MDRTKLEKLKKEMDECLERYNGAIENLIKNPNSSDAIEAVKNVDTEFKSLNKQYWNLLGI